MPAGLQIMSGGVWVSAIGGWGDCEWSTVTQGSDELSWAMSTVRHSALRGRQLVTLYAGGIPVWAGRLNEPDWDAGTFSATGLWTLAEGYPALDGAGVVTSCPDDAIDAAIAKGLSWTRPDSLSAAAFSTDTQGEVSTLAELLDAWADSVGKWWAVNARREVYAYTKPAASFQHTPTGGSPVPTDDGFVTALTGRRRTITGGYATDTVVDVDAEARWGHKEDTIDLTHLGYLPAAKAQSVLQGQLDKGRARMGWGQGIAVTNHQLLTMGGTPANTYAAVAGKTLRMHVWDDSRELSGNTTLDVMIGRSTHRQDDPVVELEPFQMAATALPDVLATLKGTRKR